MSSEAPKKQIYDDVASDYDVIWATPAVRILWTLLQSYLPKAVNLTGAKVLDLACGTGIGLRLARKLGATTLVGVDISGEMIEVCKSTTQDVGMFELHVADCSKPLDHLGSETMNEGEGTFDLVIGMWLLNYASTSAEMRGFWTNIAKYLKPGGKGKFFGVIQNQDVFHPSSMHTLKYGARESNVVPLEGGDGVRMHVEFDTSPKVEFDTFVLRREIFERTAKEVGIEIEEYVKPTVKDLREEDLKEHGEEWWEELIREYPNQIVVGSRM
jgi:toxoflavin synthase